MLYSAFVRRLLAPLVYREGTALVPASQAHDWPERMFLKRLLSRLEVDCVLDVGANLGQYAQDLRTIGFQGLVVSFEPTPSLHSKIAQWSKAHHNWVTLDVALGDQAGTLTLNEMAYSALNSFHRPSSAETESFAPANKVVRTVEVRVATLNDLLPKLQRQYGFKRPFLKIDTQGHDIAVFDGADKVHDRLVGLQSEISIKRIYEDTLPWTEAIDHYRKAGFELAGLYQVHPDEAELVEMNCFMVRKEPRNRSREG